MKISKKLVRLMAILVIMSFFMFGCGKTQVPADTNTQNEDVVVEAPESATEVEKPQEEETVELVEQEVEEEAIVEETTDETYNGMPVAQVETTVEDFNAFLNYVDSFESPGLFVYNEKEGYVIKMEEGEYYQLKADDRIFETGSEKGLASSDTLEAGGGENVRGHIFEMIPDYSKYDSPHKVLFVVYFTEELDKGEYFLLTCYMDAPTE